MDATDRARQTRRTLLILALCIIAALAFIEWVLPHITAHI